MKKRVWIVAALVILACVLGMSFTVSADNGLPEKCEHCGIAVEWTPLSVEDVRSLNIMTTGHYYVAMEEESYESVIKRVGDGQTVCLYLNGKTLYGTTRGIYVESGGTLNIMGEGMITGRGTTAGVQGACAYIEAGGTLNQYGGALSYVVYKERHATDGGVLYVKGTYNLYNGVVENGIAKTASGGNIYVSGAFNMYGGVVCNGQANVAGGNIYASKDALCSYFGGSVEGGTAGTVGNCVFNRGLITLTGDASFEELYLKPYPETGGPTIDVLMTIKGTYTGKVQLRMDAAHLVIGKDIGDSDGADLSGATITVADRMYSVGVDGQQLCLVAEMPCTHCGKLVNWQSLDPEATVLETGHYFVDTTAASLDSVSKNIYVNSQVCLHLNGKTLNGATRAFCVYPGGELNIMGSGTVIGHGANEKSPKGGVINIQDGGVLNIYGGTFTFETATGLSALNGGVLNIAGRCNMYGGEILDGQCTNAGGNVFIDTTGVLYMSGGYINNGKMGTSSNCIYNRGTVILTGNARLEALYQKPNVADGGPELKDMLIITGKYTGSFALRGSTVLGTDMGNLEAADFSGATITVPGAASIKPVAVGNDIILGNSSPVLCFNADGTATGYASLEAAIAAYTDPEAVLVLLQDVTDPVQVDTTITLDLNGYSVTQGFTGNGKVLLKDSDTDDHTVADGIYGKVKACAQVEAAQGYLLITEGEQVSAHKYSCDITAMNLRAGVVGVYFTADFSGDELVAAKVKRFGVVLNAQQIPSAANMETTSRYSAFGADKWVCGTDNTATGTMLVGIMKPENTVEANRKNADVGVYGKAYMQTEDGYIFGQLKGFSLKQLLEQVDLVFGTLTGTQKAAAVELLRAYSEEMADWNIPNLRRELLLTDQYAQVEKTATDADIGVLTGVYAGTEAHHGEMHDHAATTGTSDGNQPLEVWKAYMNALNIDFATLVDHKQVLHMRLEDWDNVIFVGGSEAACTITDREGVRLHYNMTFAEPEGLEAVLNAFPEFKFRIWSESDRAGCGGQMHFNYPDFTGERFTELCEAIYANGGFLSIVHPKAGSYVTNEDPAEAWFADYTGVEVYYVYDGDRDNWIVQENYKLWTGMLAAGKKVFATSGNDQHNMPTTNALTTFYTTEAHAKQYVGNMRVGNFTAGPVGIRMAVGQTPMGGTVSFSGQRLVFSVGDFHDCVYDPEHTYRVDLISDEGVVFSQNISCDQMSYFAIDAQNVKFYRIEVWDTTDNSRLAIGNPIWNAD